MLPEEKDLEAISHMLLSSWGPRPSLVKPKQKSLGARAPSSVSFWDLHGARSGRRTPGRNFKVYIFWIRKSKAGRMAAGPRISGSHRSLASARVVGRSCLGCHLSASGVLKTG